MKNCCCCIDLKLGGLILCYIELVASISSLLSPAAPVQNNGTEVHPERSIITSIVYLVAVAICIFGIHKEKHPFMLPHLILSWLSVAGVAIFLVLLPILGLFGAAILKDLIPDTDQDGKEAATVTAMAIFFVWIVTAIVFAIILYFTMVLQNLYKLIKENKRELLPTTDRGDFIQRSG